MLTALLLLTAACCLNVSALVGAQDKAQEATDQKPPPEKKAPKESKNTKDLTADQVAELTVFVYGSRERMSQIQRSGVERGQVTRTNNEGRTEAITYERRFVRGETSDKDKIRIDQKLPTTQYSLVYNGGRVFGVINGTSFTPRQEAVADLLTPRHHGLDALLRYKENGATPTLSGKENYKGIELWVLDLTDKEKRRTRYFVSTQKWRVLWLEYEDTPPGGAKSVKYKRTFHDYRYAQGQLVPYRTVLYADGKQLEESQVINVSYGIKMDDSYFLEEAPASTSGQ